MRRLARLSTKLIVIGSALLLPRASGAPDNAEPWRAVTRIRGSITVEYTSWIHEAGESSRTTAEFRETAQVRFVLVPDLGDEVAMLPGLSPEIAAAMRGAIAQERGQSAQVIWRAESATVTGTLHNESTSSYGSTTSTADFTGEVPILKEFSFDLTPATGEWQILSPGKVREKYTVTYVHVGDDPNTVVDQSDSVQSVVFNGTVKGKPAAITARLHDEGQLDRKPTRGFTQIARLRLWPEAVDADVEITIDGYAKWRPEGSIATPTKPGNHLVARATLVPKNGARIEDLPAVKKFRFELSETSREPGVCLNWPLKAKDEDYDLRLAEAPRFPAQLSDNDQNNEISQTANDEQDRPYAESRIDSYDFGGRTSLRVLCTLADGREIVGEMKGEGAGQDLVSLPKMSAGDWVAEAWRKDKHVEKLPANDDNEKVAGQNDNGDGFTLYEEYRGWVEKGEHIEGDPLKKDFFIRNTIGADAKGGIALFGKASKLRVHGELRASEMIYLPIQYLEAESNEKGERIMNLNHRDGPHRVDQHCVVLINTSGFRSSGGATYSVINGDTTMRALRPGKAYVLRVEERGRVAGTFSQSRSTMRYNLSEREAAVAYDRGVAHELLHSVGVDHHGEGEEAHMFYFQGAADPMNTAHRPRFVEVRPLMMYEYGEKIGGRPAVWSDFDSGPTVTLLWEDTGEDVAQSLSADFERELTAERKDPWSTGDAGSELAAKYPQYGKEAVFWSELFLYQNVSEGLTKRGWRDTDVSTFNKYVTIGRLHEADSGNELCLMRYYFANGYYVDATEKAIYLVRPGDNRVGQEVCKSPEGTGQNASDHKPKSRFGDSAPGRGNCFQYICPNDAIPPRTL